MSHLGILAHSTEGAALCFLEYCKEGARRLGSHTYPDVTLDYIAFGRSMPAWDAGDHDAVRVTLAESVARLARAGATFFACPDNTAHLALERPAPSSLYPACTSLRWSQRRPPATAGAGSASSGRDT